ncbi:MAG TPA: TDP-N-acetylfucosamine:lipid II N-acetylfucosaminyltransferase [Moheibacter sp.]|nr:TDP-N-acetylfucosamine:lipid II N-acetylfucosaminyltransferase [Moheibacter sp.]
MRKKIYHIHTDSKFLHDSKRFDDARFENILVIIGQEPIVELLSFQTVFLSLDNRNLINQMVLTTKDADLIVLYGLCPIKLKFLKKINKKHKILWRFFGYELYGKRKDLMFDSETFERLEEKRGINGLLRKIKRNFINRQESRLRKKIDYILLFSEEEYNFLKKYWNIPSFIKLNLYNDPINWEIENIKKEDFLLIGNSSSPYNNHLEILNQLKQYHGGKIRFKLFFSYGSSGKYPQLVKSKGKEIKNLEFLDKFLSKVEFESIYDAASALVINSYRQHALANIFTGIRRGVKIYLHPKNSIKTWLENEGFLVFSTKDLLNDLNNHSIKLSLNEIRENLEALHKLQLKNNQEGFNNKILEIIEKE